MARLLLVLASLAKETKRKADNAATAANQRLNKVHFWFLS
jgi:hypothetical protein